MTSHNDQVPRRRFASLLWHLADLTQVDERRRSFRAKAYRRAVWSLDELSPDLNQPVDEMLAVAGIGPGVAGLIEEYATTGRLARLETLRARYPRDVARMRRLPRANPAVLRAMKEELGVETLVDLDVAIETGGVTTLPGIGDSTAALWRRILDVGPADHELPAHRAWVLGRQMAEHMENHLDALVSETGAVRLVAEWVSETEIVAGVDDTEAARRFLETTAVASSVVEVNDQLVRLRTHDNAEAVVHLIAPTRFGSTLVETTGPEAHVAEAFPNGVPIRGTEPEVYRSVGLDWLPPAARTRPLQETSSLVTVADLEGDLHVHTEASPDGRVSLPQVVRACVSRGYRYLLVTDHTRGLRFGGLDEAALAAQSEQIAAANRRFEGIEILHGAELNIELDGSLDIDDEALDLLDFAVAAVHSRFDLDEEQQTKRVIEAIRHPKVRVLAHPQGRRIGIRPPLSLDIQAIFAAAVEEGVALELNGHRDRLDLSGEMAESALAAGCLLAVNSDAHRLGELANVENAVATAQRAGARPAQVLNTWDPEELRNWFAGGQ